MASSEQEGISPPMISLPKGGGAIRGIGEKFAVNEFACFAISA
jgi:hypothetical protein